jgi:NAD(P)-dependent dehydrogenase (short-subunit alcohol dehydrogenase family)
MEIRLDGKVAIVTGAASGIGRAIVGRYLECGVAGVIAVDRNPFPDKAGERLEFLQGDVSEEGTAERFTAGALERFRRVDIYVHNAAVSVVRAIHEHTPEEWDAVINVNVKALYWASRHLIPVMMKQRSGLILMTGSISGEVGIPTQGAYAASKGALHQMTRQMAVEYAPYNIRVNAIGCGTVDTPIVHNSAKASGDEAGYWHMLQKNHPIGRVASAEEVSSFFAYLASDYASFFTGAVLMMDGGYTAQ